MSAHKTIVVGGGHNGLVCALLLARAGRQVTVVERAGALGGLCRSTTFEGHQDAGALHDEGFFPEDLARALDLQLEYAGNFDADGRGLRTDEPKSFGEDRAALEEHTRLMQKAAPLLKKIMSEEPPSISPKSLADFTELLTRGLALRRLGKRDMVELMRAVPMASADYAKERFQGERARALIAGPACVSTFLGPWSAGSGAAMLLRSTCRGRRIKGGGRALVRALEAHAKDLDVKTGQEVTEVLVERQRVKGVALANGDTLSADEVVLTCDPKRGLLELVDPFELPIETAEEMRVVRARGTTAKIDLALESDLDLDKQLTRVFIADDTDHVERAFDAVKYERLPERPYLDVYLASRESDDLGGHVVSVLASFVPYNLEGGWTDDARERLLANCLSVLDDVAPKTSSRVRASRVLAPPDIESSYGVTGGHLHHVEHSLDQLLFMRPSARLARFESPIAGLFLGGAGAHPGGGIRGLPGALAARAVRRSAR